MSVDFSDERISAYLDGELSPEERAEIEALLASSAEHRQLVDELRALRVSLQELPRPALAAGFSDRVLKRALECAAEEPVDRSATRPPAGPTDGRSESSGTSGGGGNPFGSGGGGAAPLGEISLQHAIELRRWRTAFWTASGVAAGLLGILLVSNLPESSPLAMLANDATDTKVLAKSMAPSEAPPPPAASVMSSEPAAGAAPMFDVAAEMADGADGMRGPGEPRLAENRNLKMRSAAGGSGDAPLGGGLGGFDGGGGGAPGAVPFAKPLFQAHETRAKTEAGDSTLRDASSAPGRRGRGESIKREMQAKSGPEADNAPAIPPSPPPAPSNVVISPNDTVPQALAAKGSAAPRDSVPTDPKSAGSTVGKTPALAPSQVMMRKVAPAAGDAAAEDKRTDPTRDRKSLSEAGKERSEGGTARGAAETQAARPSVPKAPGGTESLTPASGPGKPSAANGLQAARQLEEQSAPPPVSITYVFRIVVPSEQSLDQAAARFASREDAKLNDLKKSKPSADDASNPKEVDSPEASASLPLDSRVIQVRASREQFRKILADANGAGLDGQLFAMPSLDRLATSDKRQVSEDKSPKNIAKGESEQTEKDSKQSPGTPVAEGAPANSGKPPTGDDTRDAGKNQNVDDRPVAVVGRWLGSLSQSRGAVNRAASPPGGAPTGAPAAVPGALADAKPVVPPAAAAGGGTSGADKPNAAGGASPKPGANAQAQRDPSQAPPVEMIDLIVVLERVAPANPKTPKSGAGDAKPAAGENPAPDEKPEPEPKPESSSKPEEGSKPGENPATESPKAEPKAESPN